MKLGELLRIMERHGGYSACLEPLSSAFYRDGEWKLAPDQFLHHSEFCRSMKLADGNRSCSANKKRSVEIARRGKAFCGSCPHGWREAAAPVVFDGALAAVVYCGQSADSAPEKRLKLIADARFIARFIFCELERLARSAPEKVKQRDDAFYLSACRNFIECRYQENIGLAELAGQLGVNPNYLGALLKKKNDRTFRQLLNDRRMKEAELHLKLHPNLSISKIARLCGFSDSNYFSTLFRKRHRLSPTAFR